MANVEQLIALYTRSGEQLLELIGQLEQGSGRRLRKEALLRQVDAIVNQLTGESGQLMAQLLGERYKEGVGAALDGITAAGVAAETLSTSIKPLIHQQAVQAIMDESFFSILEASEHMTNDAKQRIEDAVRLANERSLVEGVSRRQATRDAVAGLLERGITGMIAKNGAQIPADKYMDGVAQYHQRKAHVTGAENMIVQNGYDLVYVNRVGITCEMCAKYQGRVYSISGNDPRFPRLELRPPYHSHCVHSISAFIEEYQPPEEVERMQQESNRPFTDNRTEQHIKRYKEIQALNSRKNETRKQWMRYKAVLPNDTPELRTFASHKARDTSTYRELQESYRTVNRRIIKDASNPFRSSEAESIQRFETYSNGVGTASRKEFAENLLQRAGLGHISVDIEPDIFANGFCNINFSNDKASVSEYHLLENDARPAGYQTKTTLHEFYHANMHDLKHDYNVLGRDEWLKYEETATETAAHFMADHMGVKSDLAYSYSNYLVTVLPKLKQLEEFKDAVTVKDFGRKFMKYRFDPDFKTAEWKPLKDQVDQIDIVMEDYVQQYETYVFNHVDEIVEKIYDNLSDAGKDRLRYIPAIKNSLENGWRFYDFNEPGFRDSLIIAMNALGVK